MGGVLWNGIGGRQSVGALLNLFLSSLRGQVKIEDMKFKKGTYLLILQFILSLLWLGLKVFTIKVNERFIAHDSSRKISLLLSSQSGRRPPGKPLPEARAVEHWLCRMLCGGEPGEQGFCQEGSPMKCAKADWRWNAENNLLELREQEEAWPLLSGSLRILWVSASPSGLVLEVVLPVSALFFLFFPSFLPSSLPFFLGFCCGGH